jgi:hypothetical protein
MKEKLLGLICLMGLMGLIPIQPIGLFNTIMAQDSARLALRVDASQFFQDNEYFGLHAEGYTLPGFYLRPVVEWHVTPLVTLEAGAHWLHFWGARNYPSAQSLDVWQRESDTATAAHVLPWVRAEMAWKRERAEWRVVMGNLRPHKLPMPLYNPERLYATDPEAGVQMMMDAKHFDLDVWVDWREYIWQRSSRQERFTAGVSSQWATSFGKWGLLVPLHVIGQHVGGQGLAEHKPVQNHFNGAIGLMGQLRGENFELTGGCYAMGYTQKNAPDIPYKRGWGLYPVVNGKCALWGGELGMDAGYWHGHGFVPLLGSVLFSNVAYVDGITYFRYNRMMSIGANYRWKIECGELKVEGRWYRYFEKKDPSQYSVGVFIDLAPRLTIVGR